MEVDARNFANHEAFHRAVETAVDAQGGIRVSGVAGQRTLACPGIRAIDIVDCPDLTILDLSDCSPGIHILVIGCPELMGIALPRHGPGAVVHLDVRELPLPHIQFAGLIDTFDADLAGRPVALERPSRARPLAGLRIDTAAVTDVAAGVDFLQDAEAAIVPVWPFSRSQQLPEHALRQLVMLDAGTLGPGLDLNNREPMEAVVLREARGFRHLEGHAPVDRVRIDGANVLETVDLSGTHLDIQGSADASDTTPDTEALTVDGHWQTLRLSNLPHRAVHSRCAGAVNLDRLSNLDALDVHPLAGVELGRGVGSFAEVSGQTRLREAALDECLDRALAGHAGAARLIRHWATIGRDPRNRLVVLQKIERKLVAGTAEAESAWSLRCLLMVDNDCATAAADGADTPAPEDEPMETLGGHRRSTLLEAAGRRWQWRFPRDQHREGWLTDLRIYRHCRQRPETESFRTLLSRTLVPRHLATLAEWLTHVDSPRDSEWRRFIHRGLRRLARVQKRRSGPYWRPGRPLGSQWHGLSTEHRETVNGDLRLLVACAIRLADRDMADALAELAARTSDFELALRMLKPLSERGHDRARARLLRLGRAESDLSDRDRRTCIHAALRPPRSRLFAQAAAV